MVGMTITVPPVKGFAQKRTVCFRGNGMGTWVPGLSAGEGPFWG